MPRLTALTERRVRCGVSLSAGKKGETADHFAPAGIEELLLALAGYAPEGPEQRDDGTKHLLPARFDTAAVLSEAQHVGRFFYIARTAASLERQTELRALAPDALTLLTWENPRADGEALSLLSLRKEARS